MLVLIAGAAGGGAWYLYEHRPRDDGRLVLQGNVDVRQVNLAFKVEGRIETLGVDEGDAVKPGQVLATLDKRVLRRRAAAGPRPPRQPESGPRPARARLAPEEIAEARASLAEQQAAMENVRLVLQRREALMQKGSVTREEYDNARTSFKEAEARTHTAEEAHRLAEIGPRQEDIDAARAQLRAEEASVSQAERRLADSELIAPGAGEILTRARERGAIVSPGETVFTLTLSSPVWVRTYVNETDLGRVEPDMPAYVRTDSAPDKVYRGHVGFISPTAEFTPKSVETTRASHRPRLPAADRRRQPRRRVAAGHARHRPLRPGQRRRPCQVNRWSRSRASPSGSGQGAAPALDRISARVEPGQVTGLVGPDGAGKTTLLRLLAGLLLPDEGRITVCGFDTGSQLAQIRRVVSYMPQRFGLYEDLTVIQNLDLYADLRGVTGEERSTAFDRLLSSPT